MNNAALSACAIAALCATSTIATAGIVSTSGDIVEIAPPPSVREGVLEHNGRAFLFLEASDVLLDGSIRVDIQTPGFYDTTSTINTAPIVPDGPINSYFVHQDLVGSNGGFGFTATYTIEFDEEILGLIVLADRNNGPAGTTLDDSDFLGEQNGILYPKVGDSVFRGTLDSNGEDFITLSADRRSVSVTWTSFNHRFVEQMRIITASNVPGPGALAALGLGIGLTGRRRRHAALHRA